MQSNGISHSEPVTGVNAYVYGFKARAQRHHCLGYGTFTIRAEQLEALRKEYSRRIRPITYVPLLVKATALAITKNPEANAILFKRIWGYRIVQFDKVDVNLPITRELDGQEVTFVATIRNAASKTLAEIQDELTAYEHCEPDALYALQRFRRLARLPYWLVRLVHWWMTRSPRFYVGSVGTCGLTFIEGSWFESFLPIAPTSVVFGIGPVRQQPVVEDDQIVIGRVRTCALMVDNFVISGPTGARLGRDFREHLEQGDFVTVELEAARESVPAD